MFLWVVGFSGRCVLGEVAWEARPSVSVGWREMFTVRVERGVQVRRH